MNRNLIIFIIIGLLMNYNVSVHMTVTCFAQTRSTFRRRMDREYILNKMITASRRRVKKLRGGAKKEDDKILRIVTTPITEITSDVLVNETTPSLVRAGVVDRLIRSACGPELTSYTSDIRKKLKGNKLLPGQVVCSPSFNLSTVKEIFHTSTPILTRNIPPNRVQEHYLRSCYLNCMNFANLRGYTSIVLPVLCSGVNGFPKKTAIRILVQSIYTHFEWKENSSIKEVTISTNSAHVNEFVKNHYRQEIVFKPSTAPKLRSCYDLSFAEEQDCIEYKKGFVGSFITNWIDKRMEQNSIKLHVKQMEQVHFQYIESNIINSPPSCDSNAGKNPSSQEQFELSSITNSEMTNIEAITPSSIPRTPSQHSVDSSNSFNIPISRTNSKFLTSTRFSTKSSKNSSKPSAEVLPNETPKTRRPPQRIRNNGTEEIDIEEEKRRRLTKISSLAREEFLSTLKRLHGHLSAQIIERESETYESLCLRRLGHLKFHVYEEGEKIENYQPIMTLYPELYNNFMEVKEVTETERKEEDFKMDIDNNEEKSIAEEMEMENEFVETDEELDTYVPHADENVPVPDCEEYELQNNILPHVTSAMEEDVADIIGEDLLEADAMTKDIAKVVTRIRECDGKCSNVNLSQAKIVYESLLQFTSSIARDFSPQIVWLEFQVMAVNDNPIIGKSIMEWIRNHSRCYQGLRSLTKRLIALKKVISLLVSIVQAEDENDDKLKREILSMNLCSDALRVKFLKEYCFPRDEEHHKETIIKSKFAKVIARFREEMENQETEVCDICNQYTVAKEVTLRAVDDTLINSLYKKEMYRVCRMCWRSITSGATPPAAEINGMGIDEMPEELTSLNIVEQMLIQRVRAIQSLFHLRDIGGRMTSMKATTGNLVLVPVTIQETVNHVAEVLPSASKMILHVSTPWEKKFIVRMPSVLKALMWLKENNPLYADVKINEQFSFTLNDNVVFEKRQPTEDDVNMLIKRDGDDSHLLTQTHFDVDPLCDVGLPEDDSRMAVDKYRLKRDKYNPMSVDTQHIDEMVLPALHSRGRYGFSEHRKTHLGLAKYIRSRLLNVDRRFATNTHYLALMFGLRVQKDMTSRMGIQARVKNGATFKDLQQSLEDDEFTTKMSSIYSKMRGYAAYWNTVRLNLRSHIVKYGPPTFFLTLNPNECVWSDLHNIYSKVTGKSVNAENIRDEIAHDPVHFSRYWRRRVNAFFKHVILAKDGPFGEVRHYFYRVEYQHRGTQHVHAVIWTKKRPAPDAPPSEISSFIDKFLTARMPCEDTEPELHQIIANHQCHWRKHTKTCLRIFKYKGKMVRKCRFEFPRPVLSHTMIYKDRYANKILKAGKKDYYLARNSNETMINDYCPLISLLWNGNTDVQYIHSDSRGVANYVSAYTTKGEKARQERFATENALKVDSAQLNPNSFNALISMINQRQCGALEIVDHLCGHRCYEFDSAHCFIPTDLQDRRTRILLPKRDRPTDDVCYVQNFVDCYYPQRPKELENFSLMNVMINFEVVTAKRKGLGKKGATSEVVNFDLVSSPSEETSGDSDSDLEKYDEYGYFDSCSPFFTHPNIAIGQLLKVQGRSGVLLRKKKQSVPRFYVPRASNKDTEKLEEYFRRLCMTLVPWRDEEQQLKQQKVDTYHALFEKFSTKMEKDHPDAWNDIQRYLANLLQLQEQDDIIKNKLEALKKAMNELNIVEEVGDELEVQQRTVDEERHQENMARMNSDQKRIFDDVTNSIAHQDNERRNNMPEQNRTAPIHHFISGTAGTGKSFLINLLADELTIKYTDKENQSLRPSVLICAPTGLAAVQIKGSTIHSLLAIEVQNGNDPMFHPLKDSTRDLKRALFSNVRLLIIDEISMCSNVLLMKIHLRLVEIIGRKLPFGGLNLIALGDLLQLPAVRAAPIFSPISSNQLMRVFQSMNININLWNTFNYSELTENMRQKDDLEFAEIMNRMRIQQLSDDDKRKLKERIIPCENDFATAFEMASYFVQLQKQDPNCMALFPKLVEVEEFNKQVMGMLQLSTVVVKAEDVIVESAVQQGRRLTKPVKMIRPWQWMKYSLTKNRSRKVDDMPHTATTTIPKMAGGLPLELTLAEGARVMLRRNIDARNGLVNGSTGCLEKISKDSNNCPDKLFIRFDINPDKLVEISRCTAYYDMSGEERRCRTQFPIVMCFACSIHKAQGLTLKNVLVSTRSCFGAGQVFVAFSRVQNLHGLHLGDFCSQFAKVDNKCLAEYNRLRHSIGMPQYAIPQHSSKAFPTRDDNNTRDVVAVRVDNRQRNQRNFMPIEDIERYVSTIPRMELVTRSNEDYALLERHIYTTLHIIAMIQPLRNHIMSTEGEENDLKKATNTGVVSIQDVLSGRQNSLRYLASYLMERNAKGMTTFDKILQFILAFLPPEVRRIVSFAVAENRKCCGCHREVSEKKENPIVNLEECDRHGKLSKVVEGVDMRFGQKVRCDICNNECARNRRFTFSREHEYLILFQEGENKFTKCSLDGEIMFGRRWLMIGSAHNIKQHPTIYYCLPGRGYVKCMEENQTNLKGLTNFSNANVVVLKENRYTRKANQNEPANEGKTDYVYDLDPIVKRESDDEEEMDFEIERNENRRFDCLPLKNNGSDCFLNATLGVLYSCNLLRNDIQRSRSKNYEGSTFVEMKKIFEKVAINPVELRRTLPACFHEGQQDVGDVLASLLAVLPIEIREMFVIRKVISGQCRCGCGPYLECLNIYDFLVSLGDKTQDISEVEKYFTGDRTFQCQTCATKQSGTVKADITMATKYIFIHQTSGPNGTSFENIDVNNPLQLFGYMWKIKSFAEYIPSPTAKFGTSGHYVCWIPHNKGFWYVDDNTVSLRSHGPYTLQYCVLFALEKIN